jgi:hypothetical protein
LLGKKSRELARHRRTTTSASTRECGGPSPLGLRVPGEDSGGRSCSARRGSSSSKTITGFFKKINFVFTKKLVFGMVIHLTLCK